MFTRPSRGWLKYTYVEHLSPFFWASLSQAFLRHHTGVVNADVKSAIFAADQLEHIHDVWFTTEITAYWIHLTQRSRLLHFFRDCLRTTTACGHLKKFKGLDIYRHLQENQNSSGLQCKVAYWPALAVGSAAQLSAAHCPNERTLDPQSAAITDPLLLKLPSQPHYGPKTPC